jgi:hypothetical protein
MARQRREGGAKNPFLNVWRVSYPPVAAAMESRSTFSFIG